MNFKIRSLLKQIKGSEISKHILTLSFGSILSQLIPIVSSIFLARLYTPADFGDWGVFVSYATIISIIACARYEYAILRPDNDKDALNVCVLCFFIIIFVCSLILLVFGFEYFFDITFIRSVPSFILLILYVFFVGVIQIGINYANRKEKYSLIAFSSIFKSCAQAIIRIIFGLLKVPSGLILGVTTANVVGITPLRGVFLDVIKNKQYVSVKKMRILAIQYKRFPLYDMPSALLNSMSTNIPVILLAYYFSKIEVGFFAMAINLLFIPMSFIGSSLGQIFYKKACVWDTNRTKLFAEKIFFFGFIAGAIISLIMLFGGDVLFTFILGKNWGTSGIFSAYLSVWVWSVLCFSPLSTILLVKDKQNIGFIINLSLLGGRVFVIFLGAALFNNINLTVALYSMIGLIIWSIQGYIILHLIQVKFKIDHLIFILLVICLVLFLWIYKIWGLYNYI